MELNTVDTNDSLLYMVFYGELV